MIKVLFITADFYPNSTGFANATMNLVNAISKYGNNKYKIYLFTSVLLGEKEEIKCAEIFRYQNKILHHRITLWLEDFMKYKFLKRIICKEGIDIIFFETNTFPYLENYIIKSFKDKVFVRIHSTLDTEIPIFLKPKRICDKIEYYLMKKFMKEVKNIFSTSEYYIDFIKHEYLQNNVFDIWGEKSYSLLCNTINDDIKINDTVIYSNIFTTLGKMSQPGIIQKGIIDLLKAIYFLKIDGILPQDFLLNIIGDGDETDKLKKYSYKLGLNEFVSFKGNISHDDVLRYIRLSKAVILLSHFEGQSMFVTEALANGKPLILSDKNGMSELIRDDYNGLLVKTGNPKDAAQIIKKFIGFENEKVREMGENSHILYTEKFSEKAVYQQFDDAIKLKC